MRISRLGTLYAHKYKIAADAAAVETAVRGQIATLWDYPNKLFNILRACADSGARGAKNPKEKLAVKGATFCKRLLAVIDYIKVHQRDIPLDTLKQALVSIVKMIEANKEGSKFPAVNELIYAIHPTPKKHDVKMRDEQLGKASTGLSRILSLSLSMIKDLKEISGDTSKPEAERFEPARAPLAESDIIAFIRQYGNQYGLSSTEDWGVAFRDDPEFKEQITTVINALNRGHSPRDAAIVKMQIAEILKNHEERKSSNAPLFEDTDEQGQQ
jgi:hypothetical protein